MNDYTYKGRKFELNTDCGMNVCAGCVLDGSSLCHLYECGSTIGNYKWADPDPGASAPTTTQSPEKINFRDNQ